MKIQTAFILSTFEILMSLLPGPSKLRLIFPVMSWKARSSSLPSDKPIVFVCSTGARSGEAYYMVQDIRPELKEVYYV